MLVLCWDGLYIWHIMTLSAPLNYFETSSREGPELDLPQAWGWDPGSGQDSSEEAKLAWENCLGAYLALIPGALKVKAAGNW